MNFVYHAEISHGTSDPHSLQYCPGRVTQYVHKSGYCESMRFGKSICGPPLIESIVEPADEKEERDKDGKNNISCECETRSSNTPCFPSTHVVGGVIPSNTPCVPSTHVVGGVIPSVDTPCFPSTM